MRNFGFGIVGGFFAKLRCHLPFNAPHIEAARRLLDDITACLEADFEDTLALLERYHRRLCSTNGLERINQKIHWRERVIGIFLNVELARRLPDRCGHQW